MPVVEQVQVVVGLVGAGLVALQAVYGTGLFIVVDARLTADAEGQYVDADQAPAQVFVGQGVQRLREEAEFPGAPNNALILSLLERTRDLQCRVIFNGLGGDEWLWGNRRYYDEELAAGRWRNLLGCLGTDLRECGPQALWWLFRHGLVHRLPPGVLGGLRSLRHRLRQRLWRRDHRIGKPWLNSLAHELLGESAQRHAMNHGLSGGQYEIADYLADGLWTWSIEQGERMYAARGLEARSPLNTAAMVQFAAALPQRMKMRGTSHKYIHVQAMQGLLPESLRRRRDKGEFSFAFRPLLTGLADFFRGQGSVPLPRAWVDDAGLEQLYEACAADPRPRVEGLMALVCVDGSGIAGQSEYG